ncbi:acyl-coenzyme A synthetase ACSM5 [Aspergillus fijiensis CBS 313.89]|uniref:medium-chain acyl-CoA ligase n=1 Tax=Aspergillus fijiensis CBS 313.89 TaxID=1448319 RepID=A0A8G1RNK0_9EURO|nr:acyl-coenzyme A synthetase ACSM5 [Aspergillus fijiensis CBS 313.89]RAK76580.1 acyl-coenzyme A synthetase ACSM5 [Aspergillus fijiensis CBS 313.89]
MVYIESGSDGPGQAQEFHYSHFEQRAHQVAHALQASGINKGDVILLMSCRAPDWYEMLCGCMLAGVVVCPCSAALMPAEVSQRAQMTNASAIVASSGRITEDVLAWADAPSQPSRSRRIIQLGNGDVVFPHPKVMTYSRLLTSVHAGAAPNLPTTVATDPCLLYFTSGTTGEPKMVRHTHLSYPYAHIRTGKDWLDLCPGKLLFNTSDQGWAKALWAFFGAWGQGAALFLDGDEGPFEPERAIDLLHHFPITTFCTAPAVYRLMVRGELAQKFVDQPPRALEHCTSAGENLEAQVILKWAENTDGIVIRDGFGQTETSILCGNSPAITPKLGSMGKPLPGVPLAILNANRRLAHPFEEGDIAVRVFSTSAPIHQQACRPQTSFLGLFDGYIQSDGSTRRPLVTDDEGTSWYVTGDRAYHDDEGYLWYVGRGDDVINSAGHRIGPVEVEVVLKSHPGVLEAVVVGTVDPTRGGTCMKAFVVLRDAHPIPTTTTHSRLTQELREHCLQRKAAHCCPQLFEFVSAESLPRTISGKVMRKRLRESGETSI